MYSQAEGQRATFEAVLWGQKSNLNLIKPLALFINQQEIHRTRLRDTTGPNLHNPESKKLYRINVLISLINQDETNKQEMRGKFKET